MTSLKIIIVNHCHPETPHVCATRGREFAAALARRGHRVVLLTESLRPDGPTPSSADVAAIEKAHSWSRPYVLGCPPLKRALLHRARTGALPVIIGRATLAVSYALKGHVFGDWSEGTRPYTTILGQAFKPDIVWAIFGNTGAWAIARQIANASGCPWVMDVKDSWPHFIPAGMRNWVAGKFHDAAAVTALSKGYAKQAAEWFKPPVTVVYSGIPQDFLSRSSPIEAGGTFTITLTGSVYESRFLDAFTLGFANWLREDLHGTDRQRVKFCYFGADLIIAQAINRLDGLCLVENNGFVPLSILRNAQCMARLNVYVKSPRVPFHHKLIELLSTGRSVLCVPGESEEARDLAVEVGGRLFEAGAPGEIQSILHELWKARETTGVPVLPALARYTWDAQAEILEKVFLNTLAGQT